jgi:hypothetical protein
MDRFLSRESFPGPALTFGALSRPFMGEARFDGCIVFTNWPRPEVERLLPPELQLAANTSGLSDVHPVAFMFGALRQTTILLAGIAIPTGVEYHELLMAIPFVIHRRGRYLHTYIARMFSSAPASVFVGNTYYGFAKSLATMRWQGPIFLVTGAGGALLLHAAVEPGNGRSRGNTGPTANLAAMEEALTLPLLGRRADGSLVCSYFAFDFSGGGVGPADAYVSIDALLLPGLSPRRRYDPDSGSVQIRDAVWRLSWPLPPRL